MAAIFLVLAVVDAALLANVALTNTSASTVSVFDQSMTRFSQGNCCCWPPGWVCCWHCLWGLPGVRPAHGAPSVGSCGWRAARWRAGSPSWSARTPASAKELAGTRRPAALVGPQGRPARPPSQPPRSPRTWVHGGAGRHRPVIQTGARGQGRAGRRAFGPPAAPARDRQGPAAGEYGGGAPCGSGWAVPTCAVGWSEPGRKAKGGDTW
jgi:hypothetical protein